MEIIIWDILLVVLVLLFSIYGAKKGFIKCFKFWVLAFQKVGIGNANFWVCLIKPR